MAIVGTNPGKEDLTATQSSYPFPASGTWTPISGELVLAFVGNRKATAANTPTLSGTNGWNVTWTNIGSLATGGSTLNLGTLFRGVPSSGTAGVLTVDFAGVDQLQCGIVVISFSGVDQTTDQGIVAVTTDSAATTGTIVVDQAAFAKSTNGVYLGGLARGTPSAVAFSTSEGYVGYGVVGGVAGYGAQWLDREDTHSTAHTITFTSGSNWCGIAAEINALAGHAHGKVDQAFLKSKLQGLVR